MLNRKEILRYMNAPGGETALGSLIDRAEKEVINASTPKYVYRRIAVDVDKEKGQVVLAGTLIQSRDLAMHLQSCFEGFLFASTLGPGVDILVKRYTITETPMLPVIQAVSAAYTEFCADNAQKELEIYATAHEQYLRPRYSPGYGDFSLSDQRFLFDALEIPKKLGVSLTESFLMVPFKSITAVIGLSRDPSLCHINKCMTCTAKNCPFRKDDFFNG